jgi:hypothetical protein
MPDFWHRKTHQPADAVAPGKPGQALQLGVGFGGECGVVGKVVNLREVGRREEPEWRVPLRLGLRSACRAPQACTCAFFAAERAPTHQVAHGLDQQPLGRFAGLRGPHAVVIQRKHGDPTRRPRLEHWPAAGVFGLGGRFCCAGSVLLCSGRTATPPVPSSPGSLRRQCSPWPCPQTTTQVAAPRGGSTSTPNSCWPRALRKGSSPTVGAAGGGVGLPIPGAGGCAAAGRCGGGHERRAEVASLG